MKISTKGRYALRLMIDLAQHNEEKDWISLRDISGRQGISIKYLEQIIQHLCSANMVRSLRGAQGGYKLSKPPVEYSAGDILRAIEGSLAPIPCLEQSPNQCERYGICPSVRFWEGLYHVIESYVNAITLQDLAEGRPFDDVLDFSI